MLTKNFLKTKGFLVVIIFVALLLTVIIALVMRSTLNSLNTASQVDLEEAEKTQMRVNKNNLNQAIEFLTDDSYETLDLR